MNKITNLIWKPFDTYSGEKTLIFGLGLLLISLAVTSTLNVQFDGFLDIHAALKTNLLSNTVHQFLILLPYLLLVTISGFVLQSKARFIDLAGGVLVARWPMILAGIIIGLFTPKELYSSQDSNEITNAVMGNLTVLILISLPLIFCIVLYIRLLWHSFSLSHNNKDAKSIALFICAILIAEIISTYLIHKINPYVTA